MLESRPLDVKQEKERQALVNKINSSLSRFVKELAEKTPAIDVTVLQRHRTEDFSELIYQTLRSRQRQIIVRVHRQAITLLLR
jgi:hypothetical protein